MLNRSSKKIKNADGKSYDELWLKLGVEAPKPWTSGQSFAEKLQGINGQDSSTNKNDELFNDSLSEEAEGEDSEPLCIIKEDPHRNFPFFTFFEKLKKRLYKPWRKAVIVKLLGRMIGYKLLLSILQPQWAKRGVINLINIGNGYFVVKLSNKEDYNNALTGGPWLIWLIFDHYLTVRPWEPNFNPMRAKNQEYLRCGRSLSVTGGKRKGPRRIYRGWPVQKDVDAKQVLHQVYGNLGNWEEKGGGKKKQTKSPIMAGGGKNQESGRQEVRNEKRPRGLSHKVPRGKEVMRITNECIDVGERGKNEIMGVFDMEMQSEGPPAVEHVDAEDFNFNSNPLDPGDQARLSSLQGKFWIVPSCPDLDHAMLDDEENDGPKGIVVPETQMPNGL
ncbi:hypothetical protein K1719_028302 [Acacia pycnantha]|nr:hypothetical protein K1719_028302 [Acacia pycnantha]